MAMDQSDCLIQCKYIIIIIKFGLPEIIIISGKLPHGMALVWGNPGLAWPARHKTDFNHDGEYPGYFP